MKIRNGFVSNSSTSSFCIFGVEIEDSDIPSVLDNLGIKYEKDEDGMFDFESEDWCEHLESIEIPYIHDYENETTYFGFGIEDMEDDETKKQFQDRVKTKLIERLGPELGNNNPSWILETVAS